ACPDNHPRFKDLDGEAVAYADPFFYVSGSHGCSRHSGKFTTSSFIVGRLRLDDDGMLVDPHGARSDPEGPASAVELSYRLTDALRNDNRIKDAFGKALEPDGGADGLNIEGIVVVGKTLFAGLRAPNLDGEAVLVGAHLDDLFQA